MLIQAIRDASSHHGYDKVPVARWIMCDDFGTVCGLASLNEHVMRRVLGTLVAEDDRVRSQVMSKIIIQQLENL